MKTKVREGQEILCVGTRIAGGTTPLQLNRVYKVVEDRIDTFEGENWIYIDTYYWYPQANFISIPDEIDRRSGK